jgi:CBS domain-containing membrane protein
MKGNVAVSPPRKPVTKIIWSFVGAFLGILLIVIFERFRLALPERLFLVGSFGASAVLIYGAPLAEFSQPRNLVGGHVFSAITGGCRRYVRFRAV